MSEPSIDLIRDLVYDFSNAGDDHERYKAAQEALFLINKACVAHAAIWYRQTIPITLDQLQELLLSVPEPV